MAINADSRRDNLKDKERLFGEFVSNESIINGNWTDIARYFGYHVDTYHFAFQNFKLEQNDIITFSDEFREPMSAYVGTDIFSLLQIGSDHQSKDFWSATQLSNGNIGCREVRVLLIRKMGSSIDKDKKILGLK